MLVVLCQFFTCAHSSDNMTSRGFAAISRLLLAVPSFWGTVRKTCCSETGEIWKPVTFTVNYIARRPMNRLTPPPHRLPIR